MFSEFFIRAAVKYLKLYNPCLPALSTRILLISSAPRLCSSLIFTVFESWRGEIVLKELQAEAAPNPSENEPGCRAKRVHRRLFSTSILLP